MKYIILILLVHVSLSLHAAASDHIITINGILLSFQHACAFKKLPDAIAWYSTLSLLVDADWSKLDDDQQEKWIEVSDRLYDVLHGAWPDKDRAALVESKVFAVPQLYRAIQKDRVQVNLSDLLKGNALPSDAELKESRLKVLEGIGVVEPRLKKRKRED